MGDALTSEEVSEPRRRAPFSCGYCGRSYLLPRPRSCCSRGRDWDIKMIAAQKGIPVNDKASLSSNPMADIAAERRRQVEKEGWTPEHDDEHTDESLAAAAACYALPEDARRMTSRYPPGASIGHFVPEQWPASWDGSWWKSAVLGSRRRDLVKAGALILAELERLDREAGRPPAETSELSRALHTIDEAGKLSDWINRARPVITELMEAYARRIRTDCTPEELAKEPWRCMEYIGAEALLRDQPVAVVEIWPRPSEKASGLCVACGHHDQYHFDDGKGNVICRWSETCVCVHRAESMPSENGGAGQ